MNAGKAGAEELTGINKTRAPLSWAGFPGSVSSGLAHISRCPVWGPKLHIKLAAELGKRSVKVSHTVLF